MRNEIQSRHLSNFDFAILLCLKKTPTPSSFPLSLRAIRMGNRFRTILFCAMTTAVRFFFRGIFFFHTKLRNIVHITNKNYIYNNPIYNTNHLIYLFNNLIYNSNNPIYFFNNLIYNSNNKNYLSNNNNYISNIKYIF